MRRRQQFLSELFKSATVLDLPHLLAVEGKASSGQVCDATSTIRAQAYPQTLLISRGTRAR